MYNSSQIHVHFIVDFKYTIVPRDNVLCPNKCQNVHTEVYELFMRMRMLLHVKTCE